MAPAGSRLWLLATAAAGLHLHRWPGLRVHGLPPRGSGFTTNLFRSAFYTLTGFHGVHTVGIVMLMALFGMSLQGKLAEEQAEAVEIVGLYWHFVDVVWVLIFTIVYLIP